MLDKIMVIDSIKNTTHIGVEDKKLNSIPGLPIGCTPIIPFES